MILFEAFKPMMNQLDGRRGLRSRQRIVGKERYPSWCSGSAPMDRNPLVTWNVALQKLHTICSNWLQIVIEDTKISKTNLYLAVNLVTPCGRTASGRGHIGSC